MAAKSDFAQKLLHDLRLRKERMATAQNSSSSNLTSRGKEFQPIIRFQPITGLVKCSIAFSKYNYNCRFVKEVTTIFIAFHHQILCLLPFEYYHLPFNGFKQFQKVSRLSGKSLVRTRDVMKMHTCWTWIISCRATYPHVYLVALDLISLSCCSLHIKV